MKDAYIVSAVRTPGCRKGKGAFAQTRPEELISHVVKAAVEKINLDPAVVDDLMVGCSFPEAEQGLNIGRLANQIAGFPISVSASVGARARMVWYMASIRCGVSAADAIAGSEAMCLARSMTKGEFIRNNACCGTVVRGRSGQL